MARILSFCLFYGSLLVGTAAFLNLAPVPLQVSPQGRRTSPWTGPVDWAFLDRLLIRANCEASSRQLLACVFALERATDYTRLNMELIPDRPGASDKFLGLVVRDFETAHLRHRIVPDAGNIPEILTFEKNMARQRYQRWLEQLRRPGRLHLEQIWATLKEEILKTGDEPAAPISIFNAYLSVSDGPNTQVMTLSRLQSNFGERPSAQRGYGLDLRRVGGHYYVHYVPEDSPAQRSGLRQFDVVLKVDQQPTREMSMGQIYTRLRELRPLPLWVQRGRERLELILRPGLVQMPEPVMGDSLSPEIYQIRLGRFAKGVCRTFSEKLAEARNHHHLELDLRGNFGGDTDEALCVAGLLIPPGQVMGHLQSERQRETWTSPVGAKFSFKSIRVLLDSRSASSSELVAAALRENNLARVYGQRSYGKGTLQVTEPMDPNCHPHCLIYLQTVGQLLGPSGITWHGHGLSPDEIVPGESRLRLEDEPAYWIQKEFQLSQRMGANPPPGF